MRHARSRSIVAITLAAITLAAGTAAASPARPAVFQHRVPVATGKSPSEAFLWIPPAAKQVRGVVVAGMTLIERDLVKDPTIRQACADEQLAIVFLKCGLGAADVQRVLDDLAAASGYRELSVAPLLFVGHSAGGPQAKALAIRLADRCIGLVQYRGGIPGSGAGGKETPVPPGVPALMMIGQFDEFGGTMRNPAGRETWEGGRDHMIAYRAADERNLGAVVSEPGAGHFAWSDRNADYLALWIRAAARARVPADWPPDATEPVKCNQIAPATGWLSDATINKPAAFPPAAYDRYAGDRAKANWQFDEALANATAAYHNPPAGGFGKKDQFIRWTEKAFVDVGVRYFLNEIKWVGDGQTFEVHPVYADAYPVQQNGQGPKWAKAGEPVGHSAAPILVRPVSGPLVATGPNTLRVQFDALSPAAEPVRATFLACSAGDAEYRYTEQVGMLPRGFAALKNGREQTITFPPIGDLKPDAAPVALNATSDAGLPVEYYVAHGPAVVVAGKLHVSDLPARARLPVEVKLVAYQFGRGTDPQVRTATPVEQVVHIRVP